MVTATWGRSRVHAQCKGPRTSFDRPNDAGGHFSDEVPVGKGLPSALFALARSCRCQDDSA